MGAAGVRQRITHYTLYKKYENHVLGYGHIDRGAGDRVYVQGMPIY